MAQEILQKRWESYSTAALQLRVGKNQLDAMTVLGASMAEFPNIEAPKSDL